MTKFHKTFWPTILGLALCIPAAWAQQKDPRSLHPQAPYPPLSSMQSNQAPEESSSVAADDPKLAEPDQRPLSGTEEFTLGSSRSGRSYLLPSFQFLQFVDTNPGSTIGDSELDKATLLRGSLALQRVGRRHQFSANYSGGGTLYNTRSDLNDSFQRLGVTQTFNWRQWALLLSDQVSYLPESSFGYGGFGLGDANSPALGGFDANLPQLNRLFDPNQTILTARARRISNVFVGQVQYKFNPRSSFTAAGSYGVLHFLDTGFINNNSATFRTGYDYALNAHDTLAVIYGFTRFRFEGIDSGANNHVLYFAYGRRITGRLALRFSAGPQVNTFRNLLLGSGTQVSWSMGSTLLYQLLRTSFYLSYLRGMSGGSGVLMGAQSDWVEGVANRQLSRKWSGSLAFGYAHNTSLLQLAAASRDFTFNSWHARADLSRALGRSARLSFTYGLHRQSSDSSACVGSTTCGRVFLRHRFGLGFDWSFHRIGIG